jgi:hypothetical protein
MKACVLTVLLLATPALAQSPPPPPPSACAAAEHHQFDFWIGRWEVTDARSGSQAGSSLIESLYGGCVLRENWSSKSGWAGGSLNIYSRAEKGWRQTWMDQSGALREFRGGLQDGKMVLTTEVASPADKNGVRLVRMTFTPNPDGSVRQYGDISTDGGASWTGRYDLLYRRAS